MRVVSGIWKGRVIPSPIEASVRPTTDRVREALFSMLGHQIDFNEAVVADLCAGSGALGIEALSRGAAHCRFVERNRRTSRSISDTLKLFEISAQYAVVICDDALHYAASFPESEKPCDIVFFDPPYAELLCNKLMRVLLSSALLRQGGLLVAEHDTKEAVLHGNGWQLIKQRTAGGTTVDILKKE